jgi:spore maturation protein CgeB
MHMRAIEILASGAFMLTRRLTTDSSPIVDFFPEKNLAFFENEKDLVKQVDYYLEHVGERNKMAQRLRQQTIDNFSYLSIAEKIQSDIRLRFK